MLGVSFSEYRRRQRIPIAGILRPSTPSKGSLKPKKGKGWGFGTGKSNGGFGSFRRTIKAPTNPSFTFDSAAFTFDATDMTWDMV